MSPSATTEYSESTFYRREVYQYKEEFIRFETSDIDKWVPLDEPWWLDRCLKKLDEFKDLEPNWNSYDGLPIDHDLISQAKALLESVSILDIPEPFVAPVSSGGINFEWDMPLRYLSIKIRPEGVRFFCVKKIENEEKEKGLIKDGLDSVLSLLK